MNSMKNEIQKSIDVKKAILDDSKLLSELSKISDVIIECYKNGGKVILAGNGGSAADAQHIAGEFVSKFYFDRPALASIALTTDTSIMTAIGNDYGYDDLFMRQLQGNGKRGDVYIAISTSGNSANIVKSIPIAKELGITVVGFTGGNNCKMDDMVDYNIKVPCDLTPRIQESHIMLLHIICGVVEDTIFGSLRCKP